MPCALHLVPCASRQSEIYNLPYDLCLLAGTEARSLSHFRHFRHFVYLYISARAAARASSRRWWGNTPNTTITVTSVPVSILVEKDS